MAVDLSQPIYPPHMPMAHLQTAQGLLVTSLRLWIAPHREPHRDHQFWQSGMHAAQISPMGIHALDTMLWVVMATAKRELDIRCVSCPELGLDEAWLLQLVNHSQFGLVAESQDILGLWLPETAVRAASINLNVFARLYTAAGLVVEPPADRDDMLLPDPRAEFMPTGLVH
ncbi:MAG: hypothetical protein AAF563_03005 [Pseudomonadota bacterium]